MADASFADVFSGINLFLLVILIGCVVYVWIRMETTRKNTNKEMLEIKSKLGAVIREVNAAFKVDYVIDADQQQRLNRLVPSSK